MLKYLAELEEDVDAQVIFSIDELLEHLPEGFLKNLSEMEKLEDRARGVKGDLKDSFRSIFSGWFDNSSEKGARIASPKWFNQKSKAMVQSFNSLGQAAFGGHKGELDALGEDYLDYSIHRVDVDCPDVRPGSYVQCKWNDKGYCSPPQIKVEIGSFCRDKEGEIIMDEVPKNYAILSLNMGQSGVESIFVKSSDINDNAPLQVLDTENMRKRTLEFLNMASKLDKGEYVFARDAKWALESSCHQSVKEHLRNVDECYL